MRKTTISKDTLTVGLVLCVFVAIGGAINGEIIAIAFLASIACFGLGVIYSRKKQVKDKKCVELSHKFRGKYAA